MENRIENKIDNQNIVTTLQKKKRGNPNWAKGMKSPNPKGPGVNGSKLTALFTRAFEKDKELNGDDLFELAFRMARKGDSKILIALLSKCMPDLFKGEGFDVKVFLQSMTKVLNEANHPSRVT
jgi:hypothetical protein